MTFQDLNLNSALRNAIEDLGISEPTSIQNKVFSPIMAGKDVVGIAQTGTGKTFAYLLPMLRLWKFQKHTAPQILIMVPTRELVAQVTEAVESLSTYMNLRVTGVYGGTNIKTQISAIQSGVDLIVGTPGRLLDLMLKGVLKTKQIKKLVIDEVDEMLNQGFRTQLNNILDFLPERRQNLMFSATMPEEVEEIVNIYTSFYQKIEAAPSGAPLENIDQIAFEAANFNTKANLLELQLQQDSTLSKVLVFVSTKKMADALYERMADRFIDQVGVIHSSKSQNNRFNTVSSFQDGTFRFIIATDIIARGLDVSLVTHVINFDLPDVAESYIHRIGRTGRAEKKGVAYSYVSEDENIFKTQIETLMGEVIPFRETPEDLIQSDELIPLEMPVEFVPYDSHKVKKHKPSGEAFHEKSKKNQKENKKVRYEDLMKKKYKKQYRKKRKK